MFRFEFVCYDFVSELWYISVTRRTYGEIFVRIFLFDSLVRACGWGWKEELGPCCDATVRSARRVADEDFFFFFFGDRGRRTLQQRRPDDLHATTPFGMFLAGVINVP